MAFVISIVLLVSSLAGLVVVLACLFNIFD